ncbi:MAG: hypothetical protein GF405_10750 [Candidatus Eisenbacteria bacterium]|nr:hypothetical protein [Candidatus Eisenbacteria bacterium]
MCRMIAASGRFDVVALTDGLRAMASNDNRPFHHEYSDRGSDFVHADGWGVAWCEDGRVRVERGVEPCFEDPAFESAARVDTELLILHARRGTGDSGVARENTHPFTAVLDGREWVFCHNGTVRDTSSLLAVEGIRPLGGTDSERLFHHVLAGADPSDIVGSLKASLDGVVDFTCLNSFLLTDRRLAYAARAEPGTERPRYYTLWIGSGDEFTVVSSEPLEALDIEWTPMSEGAALLRADGG